jgi:hypothetical protein
MNALSRLWPALAAAALLSAAPAAAQAQAAADEQASGARHSPAYTQLRQQALTMTANELELERGRPPRLWGAIMELGLPSGAVATLVVFVDGTTSLYSSAGGGIVGAGAQRVVRNASEEFLEAAEGANRSMAAHASAEEFPHPAPGRVRFYLRTTGGVRTAEAGEDELKAGSHALSSLYTAGQGVLAQVRPLNTNQPNP